MKFFHEIMKKWPIFVVLIFQIILGFIVIDDGHNWGGDFALYVEEGKAILNGQFNEFYQSNLFTVNNSHPTLAPIAEPIFTPVLLVPFIYFFGVNLYAMKWLMLFCFIGCAWVLFKILNQFNIEKNILKFSFLIFCFSYFQFTFLLETVNSDLPFTFIALLYFLYVFKFQDSNANIDLFRASIFAFLGYLTRDAGSVFCALLLFIILLKGKKINKTQWLLVLWPLIGILLLKLGLPSFNANLLQDHLEKLSFERCSTPILTFFDVVSKNMLPLNRFYNSTIAFWIIWTILIIGYKFSALDKQKRLGLLIFVFGYLILHSFAGAFEERYFLLLQIFCSVFFIEGCMKIFQIFKIKNLVFFVLFISVQAAAKDFVRIKNWCFSENSTFRNEVQNQDATEMWNYIKKHTSKNDVIFARKPTVVRLFTERNSCVFLEDSVILNRPTINFFILKTSSGNVRHHLKQFNHSGDTIFQTGKFALIKLVFVRENTQL